MERSYVAKTTHRKRRILKSRILFQGLYPNKIFLNFSALSVQRAKRRLKVMQQKCEFSHNGRLRPYTLRA